MLRLGRAGRRGSRGRGLCSAPPSLTLGTGICVSFLGGMAGGLGSLVGLGGAFIIIPALTGLAGLSSHHAIGTSMAAVLATSLGATAAYSSIPVKGEAEISCAISNYNNNSDMEDNLCGLIPKKIGIVDTKAALTIIAFSSVFAVFGARASKRMSDRYIRQAQGILMMTVAPSILINSQLKKSPYIQPTTSRSVVLNEINEATSILQLSEARLAFVGASSGLAAGFFGIGGGAVTVPALVYMLNYDYRTALATSLMVMVPTSLTGAAVHFFQRTMLVSYALPLSVGTAAGSYFGGRFAQHVDEVKLQYIFAITMSTLGLRTFLKALKI